MRRSIFIFILVVVTVMSCKDESSTDNLKPPRDMTNNPMPPGDMTDRIDGMIFYAASAPCKAGEYSGVPDGVKSYEIECHANGTIRKNISYDSDGMITNTIYYKLDGFSRCSPSDTKCVASDPD